MANFIDTNINQTVLLDINYLDQLGKNNFDFYLYSLHITSVIPDNQFRLRDPIYAESETFLKHKESRQATRKDNKKARAIFSSESFVVDFKNKEAVCPNGKKMLYLGDDFDTPSGPICALGDI